MVRIPPELLIPIVNYSDEYSTYSSPSEAVLALNATFSFLRSLTAPLVPRTPFLRCPLEKCDPGFNHLDESDPCPNFQYKDNTDLSSLFDTVVRLEINMEMQVRELHTSFDDHNYPRGPTCSSCATVVKHLVHYLDSSSPFPLLTCLSISLPSTYKWSEKPDRCKEILSRLFGLPRLRYVMIEDPWFPGILPLPPIPSKLLIMLKLLVELEAARLKEYLTLFESVRVLHSREVTPAMLERWAPSLQGLWCETSRSSLKAIASIPEFKTYDNGFYFEARHIDVIHISNCSSVAIDFGRQSLEFHFPVPTTTSSKITELFRAIPDLMPRIRRLNIMMDGLPVQVDGPDDTDMNSMLSFLRGLPSLRSVGFNINLFFPSLVINSDTWIQETALEYAQIVAAASASLQRISLRANDAVVPFAVERDADGKFVSVSQLPFKIEKEW